MSPKFQLQLLKGHYYLMCDHRQIKLSEEKPLQLQTTFFDVSKLKFYHQQFKPYLDVCDTCLVYIAEQLIDK